ncbi:flavodoxin reductase [Guyparkeria sp. SCN-R1]|uniref:FAD-binding oxidoreductase n=1 Tax=Guyparkeria sp. SCN-R1 TaxID=2341113 RepID=UPI000F65086A|nr:FAD-binding oxidoreductase [Guyparkeria sp. SCN-R1]RRQ24526.1 flavodoxin reductase [Guyparkeria sp. SCN-R1]
MFQTELLLREFVTHDVQRYILAKPDGYTFTPGQALELAIDEPQWRDQGRPFTLTNRVGDRVLELMIKSYGSHDGVTQHLAQAQPGQKLLISEPFDSFNYEGPGWFIAAGAGITPFLAIIRDLADRGQLDGQKLIYSNKTAGDIIQQRELEAAFGENAHFVCTREHSPLCTHSGHVDDGFIREHVRDLSDEFYVCGPPAFTEQVKKTLGDLGGNTQSMEFG